MTIVAKEVDDATLKVVVVICGASVGIKKVVFEILDVEELDIKFDVGLGSVEDAVCSDVCIVFVLVIDANLLEADDEDTDDVEEVAEVIFGDVVVEIKSVELNVVVVVLTKDDVVVILEVIFVVVVGIAVVVVNCVVVFEFK